MAEEQRRYWFGPHRFGWGWSPVSPEGWVFTAALALVGIVSSRALRRRPFSQLAVAVIATAAFMLVVMATGTKPGSTLCGGGSGERKASGGTGIDPT
jgi:hypothetical protein